MERRKFLLRSLQASALMLISGSMFASVFPNLNPLKPKKVYAHNLFFWLKKDLSATEVKDFENFFEGLKKLPYKKTCDTENRQVQVREMSWIAPILIMPQWNLKHWKHLKLTENSLNILPWSKNIDQCSKKCWFTIQFTINPKLI